MNALKGGTPQFGDREPSSQQASKTMRANPSTNTQPELLLRRELWRRGFRYRLHVKELPGTPDIVFKRRGVAVFCDGDFWHGRDWPKRENRLKRGANADYWIPKIRANMVRDRRRDEDLQSLGWTVIRVWEGDIKRDVVGVVDRIEIILRDEN